MDRETQMFGTTSQRVLEGFQGRIGSAQMYIMGMLSDVQELIALGHDERARQMLNQAKFLLCEAVTVTAKE